MVNLLTVMKELILMIINIYNINIKFFHKGTTLKYNAIFIFNVLELFEYNLKLKFDKLYNFQSLGADMKDRKSTTSKMTPSQLVKQQLTGNSAFDENYQKPRIVEFLNLADYSINT